MSARICVLGSLNMDLVVRAERLPAAGETLLGGSFGMFPGGKGQNQAVAAARLGGDVALLGAVGDDAFGRELSAGLAREGVASHVEVVAGTPTGVALITVDGAGENTIVVAPGANGAVSPGYVERMRGEIAGARWLIAQLECSLQAVAAAAAIAAESGTRVLLNAAPAQALPPELLARVDVLVVNRGEAARITGRAGSAEPDALLEGLRAAGAGCVVITLGAGGAIAHDGERVLRQAAFPVAPVDTVGAGDAFVGGLAVALDEARSWADALRFGCAAGALATTVHGALPALPTRSAVTLASSSGKDC